MALFERDHLNNRKQATSCTLVLLCTYKYGKDLTLQIKELIKRARYNFESFMKRMQIIHKHSLAKQSN